MVEVSGLEPADIYVATVFMTAFYQRRDAANCGLTRDNAPTPPSTAQLAR